MAIWAAAISAGIKLGNAIKNRRESKKVHETADYNNSPQGIRDRAEAAGFNPLLFVGPGVGTGAQYAPVMGNGIAQAGAILADGMQVEEQLRIQRGELEVENKRLNALVAATTLRENVPGIYQRGSNVYQGVQGNTRNDGGGIRSIDDSDVIGGDNSLFRGVNPEDRVHGTVPYTGMGGTVIPGPNPETQMGIDEVLGWAFMETGAAAWGGFKAAKRYSMDVYDKRFTKAAVVSGRPRSYSIGMIPYSNNPTQQMGKPR